MIKWIYNDGGRSKYFKGEADDCVTRAIAIAMNRDYKEVYNEINQLAKSEKITKRRKTRSSARNGVWKDTYKNYLESLGWKKVSCSGIGVKNRIHLDKDELPANKTIICQVSGHLVCVKDRVLYDTYDCSRDGTRMVYTYWVLEN